MVISVFFPFTFSSKKSKTEQKIAFTLHAILPVLESKILNIGLRVCRIFPSLIIQTVCTAIHIDFTQKLFGK